jgi:hypothetical protein
MKQKIYKTKLIYLHKYNKKKEIFTHRTSFDFSLCYSISCHTNQSTNQHYGSDRESQPVLYLLKKYQVLNVQPTFGFYPTQYEIIKSPYYRAGCWCSAVVWSSFKEPPFTDDNQVKRFPGSVIANIIRLSSLSQGSSFLRRTQWIWPQLPQWKVWLVHLSNVARMPLHNCKDHSSFNHARYRTGRYYDRKQ